MQFYRNDFDCLVKVDASGHMSAGLPEHFSEKQRSGIVRRRCDGALHGIIHNCNSTCHFSSAAVIVSVRSLSLGWFPKVIRNCVWNGVPR